MSFAAWKGGSLGKSFKRGGETFDFTIFVPPNAPSISSEYLDTYNAVGSRRKTTGGIHRGIDIGGPVGYPIIAAADGFVTYAKRGGGNAGNAIVIHHGGYGLMAEPIRTNYAHLDEILVEKGQKVLRGDVIGSNGNTGNTDGFPHLHFGVRVPDGNDWEHANPHEFWYDGTGKVTCFDPEQAYERTNMITYPVACVGNFTSTRSQATTKAAEEPKNPGCADPNFAAMLGDLCE